MTTQVKDTTLRVVNPPPYCADPRLCQHPAVNFKICNCGIAKSLRKWRAEEGESEVGMGIGRAIDKSELVSKKRAAALGIKDVVKEVVKEVVTFAHLEPHTRPLTADPQPKLPAVLTRSDGETLLYEGRFNSLHGKPGEGKTWVSLLVVVEAIRQGSRVAIWDFEDRPSTTATRLAAVGAADVLDSPSLLYVTPSLAEDSNAREYLREWLKGGERPGMVVIDAAESSGAPSDGADVKDWIREYVTPWIEGGTTALVIDHVAKQSVDRPRGQIGSQRKLAAVDGAALFVTGAPWTKSEGGKVYLRNDKDRVGDLPERMGEWVAEISGEHVNGVLSLGIHPYKGREDVVNEDQLYFDLLRAFDETRPDVVRGSRAVRDMVEGTGVAIDRVLHDLINDDLVMVTRDGRANVYTITIQGMKTLEDAAIA